MLERKTPIKTILERGILGILFLGIVFFAFNRLSFIRKGPQVTLDSLVSGESVDSLIIPISGTALRTRELRINGQEIFLNRDLRFQETLVLTPGFNVLEIYAEDRFGTQKNTTFQIMYVKGEHKNYRQMIQEHRVLTGTLAIHKPSQTPQEVLGASDTPLSEEDSETQETITDEVNPEDENNSPQDTEVENVAQVDEDEEEEGEETSTQDETNTVESENPEE